MHGLPPDFDPSVFVGRELEQVCFTVNTVSLAFDDDIMITLEGAFVVRAASGGEVKQSPPIESSGITALLGQRVSVASASEGTLLLQFEGGGSVACLDESPEYESYHIVLRQREIHV